MVKTRYQLLAGSSKEGYLDIIRSIYRESGIKGFFRGITASYVGCIEGAVQWMAYEKAKSFMSAKSTKNELSPQEYFWSAFASKFLAIVITYPHEVVRTRLREQSQMGAFKYNGFVGALRTIAAEEGLRGLYGGMGMHLTRSAPNAAIMFLTFELVKAWLDRNVHIPSEISTSTKITRSTTKTGQADERACVTKISNPQISYPLLGLKISTRMTQI